jgi:hypothetical protein
MRKVRVGTLVAVAAILIGCHTITEELPTEPSSSAPSTPGVLTVSIPSLNTGGSTPAPTPAPTPASPGPTPTPPPEPTPTPTPEPVPTSSGECGDPLPPPIQKVNAYIHIRGPNKFTLDATPLVAGYEYCKEIGFTDSRNRCPVRPEGHPEREACEEYAVGYAEDTGRPGPTWKHKGNYCNGTNCDNHPDNQYLLWAYANGRYEACVKNGVCGSVEVDR